MDMFDRVLIALMFVVVIMIFLRHETNDKPETHHFVDITEMVKSNNRPMKVIIITEDPEEIRILTQAADMRAAVISHLENLRYTAKYNESLSEEKREAYLEARKMLYEEIEEHLKDHDL